MDNNACFHQPALEYECLLCVCDKEIKDGVGQKWRVERLLMMPRAKRRVTDTFSQAQWLWNHEITIHLLLGIRFPVHHKQFIKKNNILGYNRFKNNI